MTSRRTLKIPDLRANDLTQSQLTVLLFHRTCSVRPFCFAFLWTNLLMRADGAQFCGQQEKDARWPVDFSLRVRCCPACQRERSVPHLLHLANIPLV